MKRNTKMHLPGRSDLHGTGQQPKDVTMPSIPHVALVLLKVVVYHSSLLVKTIGEQVSAS